MSAVAEPRGAARTAPHRSPFLAPAGARAAPGRLREHRWAFRLALAALLLGALVLRVWGASHGLPYAYNTDENAHFVPRAIGMFGHALNPDYFVNPPAYTYVLHLVFAVWFGGRDGVSRAFASDPTDVFLVARVTAAVLGTVAVGCLYLAGARLVDRRTGLLAAGLLAVAALPVFYSHLALNDVPTLAPLCLALVGVGGIVRAGRRRDFALAGLGLGLACATKYTGGIVLVAVAAAVGVAWTSAGRRAALTGAVLAAVTALVAFVAANPYVVLDPAAVWDGITHQSTAADDARGKLGITRDNGFLFYLWAGTWGLGYVPLAAAALAVPLLARDRPRLALVLVPAPVLFVLFMGSQERYFGRWLLPVLPFLCLLAAYAALRLADLAARRRPALGPTLVAVAAVALCLQGLVLSLHSGAVLSREDTRNLTREWLVEHVPPRTKIVVEPGVVPDAWAQDVGAPSRLVANGNRWNKFATSRSRVDPDDPTGPLLPPPGEVVNVEDFQRVLTPALVRRYEREGFCWVVTGSTQRGRSEAEPDEAPQALAYYAALERRSELAYRASPFGAGEEPVAFDFDLSFNHLPLAYSRPGPVVSVHRLTQGRCASQS